MPRPSAAVPREPLPAPGSRAADRPAAAASCRAGAAAPAARSERHHGALVRLHRMGRRPSGSMRWPMRWAWWPRSSFIGGLALVPSAMNMFIVASLLLDRRPPRRALARYPALSVLMYVRDQAQSIAQTIESIRRQEYPGPFEVILIDDASTDRTAQIVRDMGYRWIKVLRQSRNRGKAAALNRALETRPARPHCHARCRRNPVRRCAVEHGRALRGGRARRARGLRLRAGAQFTRQLADPRAGVGLLPWPGVDEADAVAVPGHGGRRGRVHDLRPRWR